MSSLRTRLFLAVGSIALLSVALAFAIGAVLTRRAVEANTMKELSNQFDVMAQRERDALTPFDKIPEELLAQQQLRVARARILSEEDARDVRRGRKVNGAITVNGTRYLFAARLVKDKGYVLLRPASTVTQSWRPQFEGLLIGATAAAVLAALGAFFLARAIARPVRRVAEASHELAVDRSPPPLPVEGARELRVLSQSFNDMAVELRKAREAERQFLLSVSHELKTPLTAIRGYAEALAEGAFDVEDAAETIRLEGARLERLVHDLLDLARMNKREFAVRREPIDLADTAREAMRRHEGQAVAFGVELVGDTDGPAPALGDPDRILQVLSNLVENAIRVTPAGGTVRVRAEAGSIVVEDTGPGLKDEELPHAFERFFLYDRYGGKRQVGTGLGLAIVKELVHGMGGSVDVTSRPGRTRFTVRLQQPARDRVPAAV